MPWTGWRKRLRERKSPISKLTQRILAWCFFHSVERSLVKVLVNSKSISLLNFYSAKAEDCILCLCKQVVQVTEEKEKRKLDQKLFAKNSFALNQFQPFMPTLTFYIFKRPYDRQTSSLNKKVSSQIHKDILYSYLCNTEQNVVTKRKSTQ